MASNLTFSLSALDAVERSPKSDRFIPSRTSFDDLAESFRLSSPKHSKSSLEAQNDENQAYGEILKNNFNLRKKRGAQTCLDFEQRSLVNLDIPAKFQRQSKRKFAKIPFKVLDAPFLQDDYYLNVVDWSRSDLLAVGLGNAAYLWNFTNNQVEKLHQFEEYNLLSGLCWDRNSDVLAVGAMNGRVQLWDVHKKVCKKELEQHQERVGCLSLFGNLLLTGSRDRTILLNDLRTPNQPVARFTEHKQEVCGLKWSPDGTYFASGGNDNKLFVFSPKTTYPVMKKTHKAAVKAIAWSENHYGYLATGAGTADRCLRLWNVADKRLIDCKDTGSQVCNVIFSKQTDELVTTHGFSNNEVCLWKAKGLKKVHTFTGHTSRVLYLAMSPSGQHIVTGAGDETLRFWNLGAEEQTTVEPKQRNSLFQGMGLLR
jgi:cell division cycle 20-like protein 1 (cofactor of APC complex)